MNEVEAGRTVDAAARARGLLISRDLIFATKIRGTASELGYDIMVVPNAQTATERIGATPPRCLIIDLADPDLTEPVIRTLREQLPQSSRVLAFGSHVDTDRLQTARAAGCEAVMARSRLSAELPSLIEQYLGEK